MGAEHGLGPLAARLEAVLFAAAEPQPLSRLAAAAGVAEPQARRALAEFAAHLESHGHGIAMVEVGGGFQLLTRPEHHGAVAGITATRQPALSRAALETLAVVAFRQPVTRAAVDELRGVHSEGALATLVDRGLIAEAGRAEAPGRPILYVTSRRFLDHFGLRSLDDLRRADGLAAALAAAGSSGAPVAQALFPMAPPVPSGVNGDPGGVPLPPEKGRGAGPGSATEASEVGMPPEGGPRPPDVPGWASAAASARGRAHPSA